MSAAEEVVVPAADAAIEAVEAVADVITMSPSELNRRMLIFGFMCGAVAGGVTYFSTKKVLTTRYERLVEKEINEAKAFYSALNKTGDFSSPEKVVRSRVADGREIVNVEEAAQALQSYQGQSRATAADREGGVSVIRAYEAEKDETFILEEEVKKRVPEQPYVISVEEHIANDEGYDQITITYYKGDGTLADDQEKEIPAVEEVVGVGNLERFGHGSGDPSVVYIRNERLATDFEVILHEGKYAHEVLGFEHSDGGPRARRRSGQLRKVRGGD